MNYPVNEQVHQIESCLEQWGAVVNYSSDARWEMMLRNGDALPIRARLIDDWLQIRSELGSASEKTSIWSALELNVRLDGAAKLALDIQDRSMLVCAEIPLDRDTPVGPDLDATLAGFEQAAFLIRGETIQVAESQPRAATYPLPQEATLQLRELLAEVGMSYVERPGGSFMVDIENKRDFHQALVEKKPNGSCRASLELGRWDSHVPASRDALAVLLLTASGLIRMVRPVAEKCGERITVRFEIQLAPHASSALLSRGLAALSVACRLCGREVNILNNERIAGQYLAVRGFTID